MFADFFLPIKKFELYFSLTNGTDLAVEENVQENEAAYSSMPEGKEVEVCNRLQCCFAISIVKDISFECFRRICLKHSKT